MDLHPGSFRNDVTGRRLSFPSVLIVEPDPLFAKSLPSALRGAMPDVHFELSVSRDDGLTKLRGGRYHAVISDAPTATNNDFLLLKTARSFSCAVPFLATAKGQYEAPALSDLLRHGAFDILRCCCGPGEPSRVVRPALWLYQLRLTMHHRRQRLEAFRRRRENDRTMHTVQRVEILQRTIRDIEQTNLLCERTMKQIESSLEVLERISHGVERHARECAMRMVQLLENSPSLFT